jgi:hypothetical protein
MRIIATIPADDVAALDRVCRAQGTSRLDALESALSFYIEREGDLPTIDYGEEPDA